MIDIERCTDFLVENDITPSQFFFLWYTLNRKYALLYKYSAKKGAFKRGELNDLENKGFIETSDDSEGLYADDFSITEKFRDLIYSKDPENMFVEFWNAYPPYLFINSKKMPTKGCNMEELEVRYVKLIKRNVPLHNSIMNAVDWARPRGYLNTGIIKFFESRAWEYIHVEMRESIEQGELPTQNEF